MIWAARSMEAILVSSLACLLYAQLVFLVEELITLRTLRKRNASKSSSGPNRTLPLWSRLMKMVRRTRL